MIWGGILLEKTAPNYSITQYKLSYGGGVVPTYYYEAAVTKISRIALVFTKKLSVL